jgi:FPC/CPF motif-containing protein YcgG
MLRQRTALPAGRTELIITKMESQANEVSDALKEFVISSRFSCVGGKAAYKRGAVVHRHYGRLADSGECHLIYRDLVQFTEDGDGIDKHYATFAVSFDSPRRVSEIEFEKLLWKELQLLHEIDRVHYRWAPEAASDPASGTFAYSVGGKAFFVVGLHPNSSRHTRRFEFPALIFNSHIQVDRLKETGTFERMRRVIRRNEMELQGSLNPMLSDFGDLSESRQYSGRAVEREWRCPFEALSKSLPENPPGGRWPYAFSNRRIVSCP